MNKNNLFPTKITSKTYLILLVTMCIVSLSFVVSKTFASYTASGSPSPTITVQPYSYNQTWMTPLNNARIQWTNRSNVVNINCCSTSGNVSLNVVSTAGVPWYGQYSRTSTSPYRGAIRIHSGNINNANNLTNFRNYVQSVTAHEYGHVFSLAHRDPPSIMYRYRDRNYVIHPTTSDLQLVSDYYD